MRSLLTARSRRAVLATVVAAWALLGLASLAAAHDFWLVPNAFRVAPGATLEVRGQTSSSFPSSDAAVAVGRVADARVISAEGSAQISGLSVSGTSLLLRYRPMGAGQRVVAVTLHPRSVRESTQGFRRYLELEGAPDALARVEREGLLTGRDSVTRRYAKYAKTVVEVGNGGPRAFSRLADHPLEFVPESDPAARAPGDTLTVRLLYRGQPLVDARVHAGSVPMPGGRVLLASSSTEPDLHLTTDAAGRVHVPLRSAGLWNVRTIHVVQADAGSGADWDTHWATLVFNVGETAARRAPHRERGLRGRRRRGGQVSSRARKRRQCRRIGTACSRRGDPRERRDRDFCRVPRSSPAG